MIGGLMLLCAVGAMVMIAWWSLQRDDLEAAEAATGLLALRRWSTRTVVRRASERARAPSRKAVAEPGRKPRRRTPRRATEAEPGRRRALGFDRAEMAEIAEEIETGGVGLPNRGDPQ